MQDLSHWERSYSVGNWMLDNQHRNILALCQQTMDRIADDLSFNSVGQELLVVTAEHFSAEEKVLELTGYLAFARHREEHRQCQTALAKMFADAHAGLITPEALSDYLPRWCMGHILESDRHFAPFIQRLH